MKKTTTQVRRVLDQANDIAYAAVKREALAILQKHPQLTGFCMAMGTACFYDQNGPQDPKHYTKTLLNFIDEFDGELKLTGQPLRFKRVGAKIEFMTNW